MTPTQLRNNIYKSIRAVNENSVPIEINGKTDQDSAVLMSKKDYESLKETIYLTNTGTLKKVHERENDDSGFTDITNGVDWDNL